MRCQVSGLGHLVYVFSGRGAGLVNLFLILLTVSGLYFIDPEMKKLKEEQKKVRFC